MQSSTFFPQPEQKNNKSPAIDSICPSQHATLHKSNKNNDDLKSNHIDIDDDINEESDDDFILFPNIHSIHHHHIVPRKRTRKKTDDENWIPYENDKNDRDTFNLFRTKKKKKKSSVKTKKKKSSIKPKRKFKLVFKKSNDKVQHTTKSKRKKHKKSTKRKRTNLLDNSLLTFQQPKRRRISSNIQYNDDINAAKHQHITIIRKAPTLQTIAAEILDDDKKVFDHYHKYLRDDVGSNWHDSIEVGDVLEFNYNSTYKMRSHTAMNKVSFKNNKHKKGKNNMKNVITYDMPKWIPIKVTCKAYSVSIEYIENNNNNNNNINNEKDENKREKKAYQETVRVGVGGSIGKYHVKYPIRSKAARIRPINNSDRHSKKEHYLRDGVLMEIFDGKSKEWMICKVIRVVTYIEFIYKSYFDEILSDSCYVDELNIRLPSECIPYKQFTHKSHIGKCIRVYWSHMGGGEWYEGTIQSIDNNRKILVIFYKDRYMEELRWNVKTTVFYFPIKDLDTIISWIYLRPSCNYCGCLMEERMTTKCKYIHNVCCLCDNIFIEKDSVWTCPFEKKVKFHPRKYFNCSNCINKQATTHVNKVKRIEEKEKRKEFDGVINSNMIKLRNTNLIIGHRNKITLMAELYRIPIGAPLP
eukprot:294542_1